MKEDRLKVHKYLELRFDNKPLEKEEQTEQIRRPDENKTS